MAKNFRLFFPYYVQEVLHISQRIFEVVFNHLEESVPVNYRNLYPTDLRLKNPFCGVVLKFDPSSDIRLMRESNKKILGDDPREFESDMVIRYTGGFKIKLRVVSSVDENYGQAVGVKEVVVTLPSLYTQSCTPSIKDGEKFSFKVDDWVKVVYHKETTSLPTIGRDEERGVWVYTI